MCNKCNEKRMKFKYFYKENRFRFGGRKKIYRCDECQRSYALKYKAYYICTLGPYNIFNLIIDLLLFLTILVLFYCDFLIFKSLSTDSYSRIHVMWWLFCVLIINLSEIVLKWVFLGKVDKHKETVL